MAKQYIASPKLPVRFHLDAGTFEVDRQGKGGDILEPTRHLRDVLLAKGYAVHYQQVDSGHDGQNWRERLPGRSDFSILWCTFVVGGE